MCDKFDLKRLKLVGHEQLRTMNGGYPPMAAQLPSRDTPYDACGRVFNTSTGDYREETNRGALQRLVEFRNRPLESSSSLPYGPHFSHVESIGCAVSLAGPSLLDF